MKCKSARKYQNIFMNDFKKEHVPNLSTQQLFFFKQMGDYYK